MANTAAHLVGYVLPQVPYRQWVLSLPRRVRFLLACDAALLSAVLGIFVRKVHAWQKRLARRQGARGQLAGGAVTFVQRFGSLLNLNCHFHSLIPDGVYQRVGDEICFVPIAPPSPAEVERLNRQVARAIEKRIAYRMSTADDEPPAFQAFEAAESTGTIARRFEPQAPRSAASASRRSAFLCGYSLHAERRVEAEDREGLERLCRYGSRAPVSNARLHLDTAGDVVMKLRRPLRDGRTELHFTPLDFLRRLATLIPPAKKHLTRYHGVFAPNHSWRDRVVQGSDQQAGHGRSQSASTSRRIPWAELLRRVFIIDVLRCDACGSPMRILAVITDEAVAARIADHIKSRGPPNHARAAATAPDVSPS